MEGNVLHSNMNDGRTFALNPYMEVFFERDGSTAVADEGNGRTNKINNI